MVFTAQLRHYNEQLSRLHCKKHELYGIYP